MIGGSTEGSSCDLHALRNGTVTPKEEISMGHVLSGNDLGSISRGIFIISNYLQRSFWNSVAASLIFE